MVVTTVVVNQKSTKTLWKVAFSISTLDKNISVGDKLNEIFFAHVILLFVVLFLSLIYLVLKFVVSYFKRVKDDGTNTCVQYQNK